MDEPGSLVCACGRRFAQDNAFNIHQRACRKSKKRLAGPLAKAKDLWVSRKRARLDLEGGIPSADSSRVYSEPGGHGVQESSLDKVATAEQNYNHQDNIGGDADSEQQFEELVGNDMHRSLAERRPRRRNVLLPKRYRDILPQPAPSLPPIVLPESPSNDSPPEMEHVGTTNTHSLRSRACQIFRSPRNTFGLIRQYFSKQLPSTDPDADLTLADLSLIPPSSFDGAVDEPCNAANFYPYPNESSFRLGHWYWNGGVQKSQESFKELVDIVGNPDFDPSDIRDTKWNHINAKLASNEEDEEQTDGWEDIVGAGWRKTPIKIQVPFHKRMSTSGTQTYIGADLHHRPLVDVIKEKITDPKSAAQFHMDPYELRWKRSDQDKEVRVHGELYTSDTFLDAHRELQSSPGEPDCDLPRVIVGMMFSSDSTHLTSFGHSKLWPCYLYLGNDSKYRRCKPSCNLCSHVAYFQNLPDEFKDFAGQYAGGKGPNPKFFTHCHREFLHEQLKILLDDDFIKAYKHGIIIDCLDGIRRRFYPRIFTYSADYPEKILLASIRNMGACPCPRCLIPKARIHNLGMTRDRQQRKTLRRVDSVDRRAKVATARSLIYENNYAVDSAGVERLLKEESLVPTANAFSDRLGFLKFSFFLMLVIDLLHEFELGVWKALLIHLLRIVTSVNKVNELDYRYRQVPTFGRDTIRKFSTNTSELKKLAARDFEDLLQCAIPVFDGLLPEPQNTVVMQLLFKCAHWHGLAKLRIHTDYTLDILDEVTTSLGEAFREFQAKVCSTFVARELPRETRARERKTQPKGTKGNGKTTKSNLSNIGKVKAYNLHTFKHHSLGDYVQTIRDYGTTDSYSTQISELEHRTAKSRYRRTDKKSFVEQITKIERRQARIRRIKHRIDVKGGREQVSKDPEAHHHIGKSQNHFEHIGTFLQVNSGDPAVKDFLPKLKEHLTTRLKSSMLSKAPHTEGLPAAAGTTFSSSDEISPEQIFFKNDRIYRHHIFRINYTTYDVHRKQDTVNPITPHRDVMFLAESDDSDSPSHPYLYARVLGVFHANIVYVGPGMSNYTPQRFEFLWVRWFELDLNAPVGNWDQSRLDRVHFPPMANDNSFGFLDPNNVVRSCHIIPAFSRGRCSDSGRGISQCAGDSKDWASYYINRFVDRDMLMRYHWGLGIGHLYTHAQPMATASLFWASRRDMLTHNNSSSQEPGDAENLLEGDTDGDARHNVLSANNADDRVDSADEGLESDDERDELELDDIMLRGSDQSGDEFEVEDEDSDEDICLALSDMYGATVDEELDYED